MLLLIVEKMVPEAALFHAGTHLFEQQQRRFHKELQLIETADVSSSVEKNGCGTGWVDDEDVYGAEGFVRLLNQARDFAFIANICRNGPSTTATLPDGSASLFQPHLFC